jgi:predicted small lipoprotein YifL
MRPVLLLLLLVVALAGCGNKGDLYLPDNPAKQQAIPTQQ